MAAAKDSLFAQFALLNYLHESRGPRTVRELLAFLHGHTNWGRAQLAVGASDEGLRNLQNWLRQIRESAEFGQLIDWQPDPANRKQFLYKSGLAAPAARIMPIEEACTLLLAEKLLDQALPADFYDASLQDLFRTARSSVGNYERAPKHARRRVSDYLRRVAIAQRGQQLVQRSVPYDVLGVISKSMLEGKCVELSYSGRHRTLHPFGLVIKSPKIYLLAVDDREQVARGAGQRTPWQYLCSRIRNAKVSRHASRVPEQFRADEFVEQGMLDVELGSDAPLGGRRFKLELRIYDGHSDNLLRDLEEFPLSAKQTIEKERSRGSHLLRAPGMRATYQLVEWIVGRLDRVEVVAPEDLRGFIAERVAALHARYRDSA